MNLIPFLVIRRHFATSYRAADRCRVPWSSAYAEGDGAYTLRHQPFHTYFRSSQPQDSIRRRVCAAYVVALPCVECEGSCCTGHRGVLLDDGTILPFINERCPHLTDAGRCGCYETRPQGCRDFDCSREPGYLRMHPQVTALLTLHGVPFATKPIER